MTSPPPGFHAPGPADPPSTCPVVHPPPAAAAHLPAIYGQAFAADPQPTYELLRQHGPATWVEIAPRVETILVTGYNACLEVLRSPYFSKDARRWRALDQGQVPADSEVLPMMAWRPSMWFADTEDHKRLRASADVALHSVDPHSVRTYVQDAAATLIHAFAAEGRAELVAQFAHRIPALVFAQLFGCAEDVAARMAAACGQMIDAEPAVAQRGGHDLTQCLAELIATKRRTPGADITSALLQHPSRLDDDEIVNQLVVFIGAGTVPEGAWIASALMMLLADDRFASDLSGGSLTVDDALNEVLWRHPPLSNFSFLYATSTYPLRDPRTDTHADIPEGVPVLISHAAANTDPEVATGPQDRLANTAHLAWGAGPHACPAKNLATIIAVAAIETLLDTLPDMELAVAPAALTWRPGPFHRTLTALPVRFTPQRPAPPSATTDGGTSWKQPAPAPARTSSTPPEPTSTPRPPTSAGKARPRKWSFPAMSRRGR